MAPKASPDDYTVDDLKAQWDAHGIHDWLRNNAGLNATIKFERGNNRVDYTLIKGDGTESKGDNTTAWNFWKAVEGIIGVSKMQDLNAHIRK